jgi:hypothetical protein
MTVVAEKLLRAVVNSDEHALNAVALFDLGQPTAALEAARRSDDCASKARARCCTSMWTGY